MPSIGILQGGDQLADAGLVQAAQRRLFEAVGHDAVDAATIVAAVQVEVLFNIVGQRPRMLDDFAVHIDDVQCAVGRIGKLHRAKPGIFGGDELDRLLIGRALRFQAHAVGNKNFSMDEVAASITEEGIIEKLRWKRVAAVDRGAGGPGEITGRTASAFDGPTYQPCHAPFGANDTPGLFRADAVHLGRGTVHVDAHQPGGHGIIGISGGVAILIHIQADMVAVVAGEAAAKIIEAEAMLAATGFRGHGHRARIDHKIAAMEFQRFGFGMFQRLYRAAVAARRAMDSIDESPNERVEHGLHVDAFDAFGEAGENHFADVRLAVAVGVLEVKDVGRSADENAAIVTKDSGWPGQVVRKDCAFIKNTVAVSIFEHTDASQMRNLIEAFGVIDHFHHTHASVFVEGEGDRTDDVGLGSDQLHVEAFLYLEGIEGVPGFDRGDAGQVVGGDGRFGGWEGKKRGQQEENKTIFHTAWSKLRGWEW